jgi:hypothetical protein
MSRLARAWLDYRRESRRGMRSDQNPVAFLAFYSRDDAAAGSAIASGSQQTTVKAMSHLIAASRSALGPKLARMGEHVEGRTRRKRHRSNTSPRCSGWMNVSKRADATYQSGPCRVWIKVRDPASIARGAAGAKREVE